MDIKTVELEYLDSGDGVEDHIFLDIDQSIDFSDIVEISCTCEGLDEIYG